MNWSVVKALWITNLLCLFAGGLVYGVRLWPELGHWLLVVGTATGLWLGVFIVVWSVLGIIEWEG